MDVNGFIEEFKSNLFALMNYSSESSNSDTEEIYNIIIESICEQLRLKLESIKNKIPSLDKARKMISKKQLSDLQFEDGPIVDQIWEQVGNYFENHNITKDQLFGKEKLSIYDNSLSETDLTIFEGIIQCHTALNYLGFWPDNKLTRNSKMFGINSDASHIAHGYFCESFLSADDRLCKKAAAIYEYFGKIDSVFQVSFRKH